MPVAWRHGPSHRDGDQCHESPAATGPRRVRAAGAQASSAAHWPRQLRLLKLTRKWIRCTQARITGRPSRWPRRATVLDSRGHGRWYRTRRPEARVPAGHVTVTGGHGDRDCQCGPGPQAGPSELGLVIMPTVCWPMIAKMVLKLETKFGSEDLVVTADWI
jgi:hypothetical protein